MKPLAHRGLWVAFASLLLAAALAACSDDSATTAATGSKQATPAVRTLLLGAYTTPREAYGKAVIPAFQRYWRERTGEEVRFQESYLGSGAQSRAIVGGFEADVAALSLEADIVSIAKAGLITHDWKAGPASGIVTQSIVVLAVRAGNPKGIRDWDGLRAPGLNVLTPNVRTSGGAMWNVCALYGAAQRGHTAAPAGEPAAAEQLLADVLRNVSVMDKGARESIVTFEEGVGDVAITYESGSTSRGFPGWAQDGIFSFILARVFGSRRAIWSPLPRQISVAITPAPPERVTMAARLPRGKAC